MKHDRRIFLSEDERKWLLWLLRSRAFERQDQDIVSNIEHHLENYAGGEAVANRLHSVPTDG